MSKKEALKRLNTKIDELIIKGKANTKEYKRLCGLHLALISEMGLIK